MKSNMNPWWWIPTLYFAEGLPYFIVNNISVIMFNNMGMPKGEMALYTSMLYLPWVIKPLWSPFVDIIRTKRWWILAMQVIMSAAFALLAFSLPHPSADVIAAGGTSVSLFKLTLVLFWITAFASATHDIAADGFYMLALKPKEQSVFVGIRSTFYRLASIFGQGVLVVIAGILERKTGDIPQAWSITLLISAVIFSAATLWHTFSLPKPESDALREKGQTVKDIIVEFGRTFATFFCKRYIWISILFMLLYRLPEAFLVKMMNPFLLDPVSEGGLGLATETVGWIYGTIGVAALTVGGILGGIAASRWGLKKSLWPMATALTLPCLSFEFQHYLLRRTIVPAEKALSSGNIILVQFSCRRHYSGRIELKLDLQPTGIHFTHLDILQCPEIVAGQRPAGKLVTDELIYCLVMHFCSFLFLPQAPRYGCGPYIDYSH